MEKKLSLNASTNLLVSKYSIWLTQELSDKVSFWITHKIRHTYAVLHCAQQIIKEDAILNSLDRKIKKKIEIAALLHDIARFTQHDKVDILKESIYEH
jgi:HD superfamily phosphodiesterase